MSDDLIGQRKLQEETTNFIESGYYKVALRLQKAMYDEYLRLGFTAEQALELIKAVYPKGGD